MWRWVTRGLFLLVVASLCAPAVLAQQFIGALDSPDPAQTQYGMVLVRGFVLDQQQVTKIELYVDDAYQYNVNFGLPRIDIVEAYPNYPGIHDSAPGFQTGFTASRFSNGPHTVYVRVYTADGAVTEVGRRTVNVDNTLNQPPFGSVDIPDAGSVYNAAGSFPVSGWAADTDGIKRIDVQIDDGELQSAMYGDPRPDVGNAFPDFPGALFSGWIANVDTTRVQDGVHTLTVRAVDNFGVQKLIGRRQVQILNAENQLRPFGIVDEPLRNAVLYGTQCGTLPIFSPPINVNAHITPIRGWALDLATREDVGRVSYVELLIDGVRWASTDDCFFFSLFGAYTNCYGMPRYDVERYYPNYPDAPKSGFMFTVDVGALLALGVRPGPHVLKVRVGDQQQNVAEIPNRDGIPVTFTCVEETFDFAALGYIDIPTRYDYVKGNTTFQGWAFDENGGVAAVEIIIDGNYVGQGQYGFPRPDVIVQHPEFNPTVNTGWKFVMDTTLLSNARHQLTVRILDAQGHRSEIGSQYFYVDNPPPQP